MKTLEELTEELKQCNLSDVARSIGVTRAYVSALASGKRLNPTYEIICKLNEYMENKNNV